MTRYEAVQHVERAERDLRTSKDAMQPEWRRVAAVQHAIAEALTAIAGVLVEGGER